MTAFADSSALVKRYADEDSSAAVRDHEVVVVSALARVEVPAALWRKHRMQGLTSEDAALLTADFENDWHDEEGPFAVVPASLPVLDAAAVLAARHGLRAYDAVQLASALAAREADRSVRDFLCFDGELREAAVREGFLLSA